MKPKYLFDATSQEHGANGQKHVSGITDYLTWAKMRPHKNSLSELPI